MLTKLEGYVRFKVAGQKALPKWQQTAIRDALKKLDAPPESLRFQCRIATDAHENFKLIELANGETLKLHYKSQPQFGKKTRTGEPYLTATFTYSGDGENYTVQWLGDAVPPKMQEVAVKHDQGLSVSPVTIALDLGKARVTPSWKAQSKVGHPKTRDLRKEYARKLELRESGAEPKRIRSPRHCARITEADIA